MENIIDGEYSFEESFAKLLEFTGPTCYSSPEDFDEVKGQTFEMF